MIVICPNCGTRYKMPDGMALAGKRMRCAECEHRWTLPAADEDEELVRTQDALRDPAPDEGSAAPDAAAVEGPGAQAPDEQPDQESPAEDMAGTTPDEDASHDEEDKPRSWLAWGVALVVAAALALLAGAIWLERLDPARVPVVGGMLAGLQPGPSSLSIVAEARLAPMADDRLLLDVQGEISNRGSSARALAPLKASLSGPTGVVRRWTITPPVAELAPGASVRFSSTLTDVPAGARQVRIIGG